MSDIANLEIRVSSDQVPQATSRLGALERQGGRTERATDGLAMALKGTVAPLVAMAAAAVSLTKLISVTREFDKLNTGLITATQSAEGAAVAFEALQDFAANTPYDLAQVTDSFTKLVNYGLDPSERALMSYGNTASALGKDLNQMVEAVADAATGEFERLKEFGIRASKEGDQVKFTFRGVSESVRFNAAEIEQYLIKLGENNFSDAMTNRMSTLDGAISNLGDEWDSLYRNISQLGVGDLIESAVRIAVDALSSLNATLASGEVEANLTAIAGKFSAWGRDIETTFALLEDAHKKNLQGMEVNQSATIPFLIKAFKEYPENVRAMIQIMTVEVAVAFDRLVAHAAATRDSITAVFTSDTQVEVARRFEGRLQAISQARTESLQDIMNERDASLESFDAQIAKAKELRAQYDAPSTGDRLSQFRISGDQSSEGGAKAGKSGGAKAGKSVEDKTFERLVESLRTEEEAIQESYERRMAIIVANTEAGSLQQQDLSRRLQTEYEGQLASLAEAKQRERDVLWASLLTEDEMLQQAFDRKKALILESTEVTELERQELLRRLKQQYDDEQEAAEMQRIQMQLGGASALFDGLAGLAKAYGGEQSKAYRVMFAVSKGFAVAQAALSIATGLAKAQELGWPANLAAMAQVATAGASIVSTISGSNYSGAYDKGGRIPAGKIGLVGEMGPELIEGPAKVTSRAETARMLQGGKQESSGGRQVTMHNTFILNSEAQVDSFRSSERQLEASLAQSLRRSEQR